MNIQQFRDAVIDVTLKAVDKDLHSWVTFNDSLHTKIIRDTYLPDTVKMEGDELPILECDLKNDYLLITTDRVISISNNVYEEMCIKDMEKLLNDYEGLNYEKIDGQYPKTNKIAILKTDRSILTFLIDSYYPAFFSKILINNIFSYKVKGYWYLNPSKKKW